MTKKKKSLKIKTPKRATLVIDTRPIEMDTRSKFFKEEKIGSGNIL